MKVLFCEWGELIGRVLKEIEPFAGLGIDAAREFDRHGPSAFERYGRVFLLWMGVAARRSNQASLELERSGENEIGDTTCRDLERRSGNDEVAFVKPISSPRARNSRADADDRPSHARPALLHLENAIVEDRMDVDDSTDKRLQRENGAR